MSGEKKEGSFDELLKSLGAVVEESTTLAKALPTEKDGDDKQVQAAAADSGVGDVNPEDDDPDDKPMAKALGDDMVDATDLIKSIIDRQDKNDEKLTKALTTLTGALSAQNQLVKSLQTQVAQLAGQGRGRKAMISVAEKPNVSDVLAKSQGSEEGKITHEELLAKSEVAFNGGKITGNEFNTVDVCLRYGQPIDQGLLRKIAAA